MLSVAMNSDEAAYAAVLDEEGVAIAFERLPYLLFRPYPPLADPLAPVEPHRQEELRTMNYVSDIKKLRDLVVRHKPHAVAISAENSDAIGLQKDLENMMYKLTDSESPYRNTIGLQAIDVHLVDPVLAVVYSVSKRGQASSAVLFRYTVLILVLDGAYNYPISLLHCAARVS